MRTTFKKAAKKTAAVALALAMALAVAPGNVSLAKKVTKPKLTFNGKSVKKLEIIAGDSAKLKVKAGTYKIKSTKWTSSNKKVATVSKGTVKATAVGKSATIKAVVTTKKSKKKTKKYTLSVKVKVIQDTEPADDANFDVWIAYEGTDVRSNEYFSACILPELPVKDGATYTPVAFIGHKEGSDGSFAWKYLAIRDYAIGEESSQTYALVEAILKADGSIEYGDILVSEMDALPRVTDSDGAMFACDDPSFDLDDEFDKAVAESNFTEAIGVSYRALAKVGSQLVAGRNYWVVVGTTIPYKTYSCLSDASIALVPVSVGLDLTVTPDLAGIVQFTSLDAE